MVCMQMVSFICQLLTDRRSMFSWASSQWLNPQHYNSAQNQTANRPFYPSLLCMRLKANILVPNRRVSSPFSTLTSEHTCFIRQAPISLRRRDKRALTNGEDVKKISVMGRNFHKAQLADASIGYLVTWITSTWLPKKKPHRTEKVPYKKSTAVKNETQAQTVYILT